MSPPALLCPPWQGHSPKSLSPGTQPQPRLAQVTRNTSGTWLLGLELAFSACLWHCWTLKPLSLPVMGKTPNIPPCWLLLLGPSFLSEQQNPRRGREFSCWREQAGKVLLMQTHKYSQTHRVWPMSWVQVFFNPSSLVYHQMRAHWEKFWKKIKLVYPSKKWTRGQNRGQIAALTLLSLQRCVSLCNVNITVIF